MGKKWKRFMLVFLLVGILYAGCNSRSILAVENLFRHKLPTLSLSPNFCYFLANVSYGTLRYELALGIIERNLHDFPYERGAVNAEHKRARCCENLGDCDRAIELYQKFLYKYPHDRRCRKIQKKIVQLQSFNRSD